MSQRKEIEAAVKHVTGKVDKDVLAVVERGISRGYDRRKFKDRLSEVITDRSVVSKLSDRIIDIVRGDTGSGGGGGSGSSSRKRPKFEEFPVAAAPAAKPETNGRADDNNDNDGQQASKMAKKEESSGNNHVNNQPAVNQPSGNKVQQNGDALPAPALVTQLPKVQVQVEDPPSTATAPAAGNGEDNKPTMALADKLKIKQVMAQAQKAIEDRKKQLNIVTPAPPAPKPTGSGGGGSGSGASQAIKLAPGEAQQYMEQAMKKAVRAAELKAKIDNRFPGALKAKMDSITKGGIATPSSTAAASTSKAAAASLTKSLGIEPVHTIKANIRNEKAHLFRQAQDQVQESQTAQAVQRETESKHFDAEMGLKSAVRPRRAFRFHERGEFEQLANKQRAKSKLDKLQAEISSISKRTGISSAVKLAMAAPKSAAETEQADVPDMEWWDGVLFTDDYDLTNLNDDTINAAIDEDAAQLMSALVEHPIQLRPPDEPLSIQYLKVYLTKKEQKKLRRQNRKELQRERNEKIRLGLEAPPEPKMKISNLMRVLGTDAIKDPTKMEAHVRKQMAERMRKHEEANKERKLTKEQQTAKKIKKITEDVSTGVHVSVYRVADISNPSKRFKVEMNAKQLKMTGLVVLHKDINVIVVEGGPKQQKFYRRLMMNRIKWEDDVVKSTGGDDEGKTNKCSLVWEGVVRKRSFGDLKFKQCALEKQARELMEKYGVPEYWDMAYTGTVVVQEADEDADGDVE